MAVSDAVSKSLKQQKFEESKTDTTICLLALGLVFLVLGKFLVVIFTGLALGWFPIMAIKGAGTAKAKVHRYLFTALFFAVLTLFLFGLPGRKNELGFPGIASFIPSFEEFSLWACMSWNKFISFFIPFSRPFFKKMFVTQLRSRDVSDFAWIGLYALAASPFVFGLFSFFKKNRAVTPSLLDRSKDPEGKERLDRVATAPAHVMSWVVSAIALSSVKAGFRKGTDLEDEGLYGNLVWLTIFVVGAILTSWSLDGQLLQIPLAKLITYPDVSSILLVGCQVFMAGPLAGFLAAKLLPIDWTDAIGLHGKYGGKYGKRGLHDFESEHAAGFLLGKKFNGELYRLTEANLGYHVEVIAPTGSGKTNLLKNLISDRIHRGHGVIFLDLKADFQLVSWMMKATYNVARESQLRLISLADRELSVPYNPIKFGSAPEIHSQLMNAMSWSEEYYRKISSIALMTLLRGLTEYRDREGEYFHLGHLYELLNEPGLMRSMACKLANLNCKSAADFALLSEKLDRPREMDKLSGLLANLNLLIHSGAGGLISDDVVSGSFDFKDAAEKGLVTYVLMNSLKLRESATVFGKLILQDLMKLVGERYSDLDENKYHRPITLVIDEFAAFAMPEFIEFMDRARGAGIGIIIAHQSRADLRALSPEFQSRVESNANTVIVSGVKSAEDADHFAGMAGTRTVKKETSQVETSAWGESHTGMKSVRDAEEYIVHPNLIKDLRQGEVFTISNTVDAKWGLVKVPEAYEFRGIDLSQTKILEMLKQTRQYYMNGSRDIYLDLKLIGKAQPGLKVEIEPDGGSSGESQLRTDNDLWS